MANSIITVTTRQKMVKARAGLITLPTIVGMAFGIGGVDVNNIVIPPDANAVELQNEVFRKVIDGVEPVTTTCYRYTCTLAKNEMVGEKISEIALYDSDGDIVSIKSFTIKEKDGDMEMIFDIDDQF